MAMNKKEREEVQALRDELAIAKAWRRTEPVPHDVPVSNDWQNESSGWVFSSYNGNVQRAWSTVNTHGVGYATRKEGRGSASQRGIPMYSTELLALRALRYEVEQAAAKSLASIDARIEAAATQQQGERSDG